MKNKAVLILLILLILLPAAAAEAGSEWKFPEDARSIGPNGKLLGDVELLLVFVDTPAHPWTEGRRNDVFTVISSSMRLILDQAAQYNVPLDLSSGVFYPSIPYEIPPFDLVDNDLSWYYYILENYFHFSSMTELQKYYEKRLGKDDTPVLFFFNSADRLFSYSTDRQHSHWDNEFAVYFCEEPMNDNFITHELLHLYGAHDLYNRTDDENIEGLASVYFPNSVMSVTTGKIDELTAYLIGWTDRPSDKVRQFLYLLGSN